jgi:hypothetical protein
MRYQSTENKRVKKPSKLIPLAIKDLELNIDPDRRVLYRKTQKFNKKEFVIEISKTKCNYNPYTSCLIRL